MTTIPKKVKPDPSWSWQEKWVWSKLRDGEEADFNADPSFGGPLDPKDDSIWTEDNVNAKNRILTPKFLQTILLDEPFRSAIPRQGVDIRGGWFREPIEMKNASIECSLMLLRCRIDSNVYLNQLISSQSIALNGSTFRGMLNMNGLHVGGDLFMRDGAEFSEVDLKSAKVDGQVDMSKSRFNGKLNMNGLNVMSGLFMRGYAEFNEVELVSAKVNRQVDMSNSTFNGKLDMNSIHVEGNLFMRKGAEFSEVELVNAIVDGQISMINSKFNGKLNMNGLHVGGDLFMRDGAEFSEVELISAIVDGQVDMSNSRFNGKLMMESLQIGQHLFMRDIFLTERCSLLFALINGGLSISNRPGTKLTSINMTGAHVKKDFQILNEKGSWSEDAKLSLRNCSVGALQDGKNAWPEKLDLDGFTYNRLGGYTIDRQKGDRLETRGTKWMIEWLAKHEPYSPQPYEQLAKVLRESGHKDTANKILYASKVREYSEKEKGLGKAWLWLLDNFIGYGYYPERVLIWIAIFTVIGALSLQFSRQGEVYYFPYGISYSFDMLLPIIELNTMHYSETIKITGLVKYYFYFHKLIGWFLASVLIAGLSGITKK